MSVEWIKALDFKDAIWGKGFFANRYSVCRPRAKTWHHTVKRLKQRAGVR